VETASFEIFVTGCNTDIDSKVEEFLSLIGTCGLKAAAPPLTHRFTPHGVTGMVVLMESGMMVHTYPEHRLVIIDFRPCEFNKAEAMFNSLISLIKEVFKPDGIRHRMNISRLP